MDEVKMTNSAPAMKRRRAGEKAKRGGRVEAAACFLEGMMARKRFPSSARAVETAIEALEAVRGDPVDRFASEYQVDWSPTTHKWVLVVPGTLRQGLDWIREFTPEVRKFCKVVMAVRDLAGHRREHVRVVKLVGEWWLNDVFNHPEAWSLLTFLDPTLERMFEPGAANRRGRDAIRSSTQRSPLITGGGSARRWPPSRKKRSKRVSVVGSVRCEVTACQAG